ncbi:MAG: prolyl oligopeptidase family serine peptidase [Verrucomicrobiales bacterium]
MMPRRILPLLAAVLCAPLFPCQAQSEPDGEDRNQPKELKVEATKQITLSYLLALPPDYEAAKDKKYPVMLFLHGAGERGDDLEKVKVHGPPKLVGKMKELDDFIIVSPQCPKDQWWDGEALRALVDEVVKTYRVDEKRLYCTGLSMGGYGTWMLSCRYPDLFAAIVPICGGGEPKHLKNIKDMPIWVFHGAKDTAVKIGESERLVEELKRLGNDVKFTVYPEAGHDCWTESYANPELYAWLLSKAKE